MGTKIFRGTERIIDNQAVRVVTLGSFDGLHRGHCKLLSTLKSSAEGLPGSVSSVISFYPHPALALGKCESYLPLLSLHQRCELLSRLGIDELILIRFSRALSSLSAKDFIKEILCDVLKARIVCLGPDARMGKGRGSGVVEIEQILRSCGAELRLVPHLIEDQAKIGSRMIRSAVATGSLAQARAALGRPVSLQGRVVQGDGRGKSIAFPTANLSVKQLLPAFGVYTGRFQLRGEWHEAVINVGKRPTFNGRTVSVEAHLYQYQGADFYGERVTVEFLSRIREEKKFSSVNELVAQIRADVILAQSLALGRNE